MTINKKKKSISPTAVIIAVFLIAYTLIMFFFLYLGFITSLKTETDFVSHSNHFGIPRDFYEKTLAPWNWEWGNFLKVTKYFDQYDLERNGLIISYMPFGTMVWYTILYAGVGAFIATLCPCIVAYATSKFNYKFNVVLDTICIVTMIIPVVGSSMSMVSVLYQLNIYDTLRYYFSNPGLIYEIYNKNGVLAFSLESSLSRKSKTFCSNREKFITTQLGFGFRYDSTQEDDWRIGKASGFSRSTVVQKTEQLFLRPIKKTKLGLINKGEILLNENNKHFIIDLQKENVGLPSISFSSEREQNVIVTWGEHLADGKVRRIIAYRDFSFEYRAKKGLNNFTNYMLRLGCRYIELFFEDAVNLQYAGIIPATYNVVFKNQRLDDALDNSIYNLCKHTLKSCMLEHYTDCPWREQALYAFDSRNQMLSGYYLFEDKNKDYARANLILIAKDNRKDGLLSICCPSSFGRVIPSYSLYYIIAVAEYVEHTNDKSILSVVTSKMLSIIKAFISNKKNGLISRFSGEQYWNFYEWSDGYDHIKTNDKPDCAINCLFAYALKKLIQISAYASEELLDTYDKIKEKCFTTFYDENQGGFVLEDKGTACTEFVNSLAVISGVCPNQIAPSIIEKLSNKEFTECSLAMKIFKYQVLMEMDKQKYKDVILEEIRSNYGKMLKEGSTTAWETTVGQADFANAGSLCHGWSAYPIYIYNELGLVKQD